MSEEDVRNRFRSPRRRDFVGPLPKRPVSHKPDEPADPPLHHYQPISDSYEDNIIELKKPRKSRKKLFIITLVFLILGAAAGGAYYVLFMKDKPQAGTAQELNNQQTTTEEQKTEPKKTLRLVATGDMIPHSAILERGKTANGYDFTPMLANMKPYFAKSDVNFCNQATPAGGESFGYSGYPIFNAPTEWPRAIEGVGCNVINIGTNHTNDKGQPLIDATVAAWDNRPVFAVVGANRNEQERLGIRNFEKDGLNIVVLSYSTYSNNPVTNSYGVNMYDSALASKEITKAKEKADIIIVSMRWGTEYSPGVDATQDRIAQELSNYGADVVLGHGPHFLEPVKKLKGTNGNDTLVWFSLGNFLNAQIETEALIGGFAIMDIDIATKKIADPKFMPVYMHYEWTAAQKAANDLLARQNFQMYPLDKAAEPMSKSQMGTTVEAQTDRVTKLLNQFTPVSIIKSDQF